MGKTCVICGKPSGMYPLCREHLTMKNEGTVVKCPNCGTWHFTKEICECQKPKTPSKKIQKEVHFEENVSKNDEITCLLCGEPSNGKHFCAKCWKENFATYGNEESKIKRITVVIDNHLKCEIIDKYGNKNTLCSSGAFVRSDCEARIADKLYEHKICVAYEKVVPYDDEKTGERKLLHPDFYLPEENLYIEYNGLTGKDYLTKKEYTEKIYKNKGLNILTMSHDDLRDLEGFLAKNLKTWK